MGDQVGVVWHQLLPPKDNYGQALDNFIVKFTYADTTEVAGMTDNAEAKKVAEALREKNSTLVKEDTEQWTLYVDGASNDTRSRACIMLISSEGRKIHCALCFRFKVSNTKVEYEALIAGLRLVKEL